VLSDAEMIATDPIAAHPENALLELKPGWISASAAA
jgi:hypothetical protein